MTKQIRFHRPGGPEVLTCEETDLAAPGRGEVRLRQFAAGVNYVDVYHRSGLYPVPALPSGIGVEGAGLVEAVGPGVTAVAPGDRVAYAGLPVGGYAEARLMPAERLVKLPDAIGDDTAAAMLSRGITAHMLLTRICPLRAGESVLIHAAAGGLGLVLAQWAKRLGARVIGTVGSAEKAALATAHGLDHAILYRDDDFVAETRRLTDGKGVDVAIDGIGGETLRRTLDAVRPFGMVASVGQAGGALPTIALDELGPRRSLALARPSVLAYMSDPARYHEAARAVMTMVEAGLRIEIGARFPLADAAAAHRAMESRHTTGSVLLIC